jgi:hypothetical protein
MAPFYRGAAASWASTGAGLALYNAAGVKIGAIGVSGDTSCADHNIAWKVRDALALDFVPNGVASGGTDNIVYDLDGSGKSTSGFDHPESLRASTVIAEDLPTSHPSARTPRRNRSRDASFRSRPLKDSWLPAVARLVAHRPRRACNGSSRRHAESKKREPRASAWRAFGASCRLPGLHTDRSGETIRQSLTTLRHAFSSVLQTLDGTTMARGACTSGLGRGVGGRSERTAHQAERAASERAHTAGEKPKC